MLGGPEMKRRALLRGAAAIGSLGLAVGMDVPAARARVRTAKDGSKQLANRAPARGPLRVLEANRRYFTDGSGRAVLLAGAHTWNNLVDMGPSDPPPAFDYAGFLDFLGKHGHNAFRLWTWESVSWDTKENIGTPGRRHSMAPLRYARTGPGEALDGKPKFDVREFDDEYFRRLRDRVELAGERGCYAIVMLFEGWAMQFSPRAWEGHPFHPANNINGVNGDPNETGRGLEIFTLKQREVTALQEAYARQVVDTVNHFDNVLYEISNENHTESTEWQYHMIRFVQEHQRSKAKQHPVGMTFQYRGGSNAALFESPADWISPNPEGGYKDDPPAGDGRKVILNDTDHLWGTGGNAPWVWKSFLRGHNVLLMDPYDDSVLGKPSPDWDPEPIRKALGSVVWLSAQIDLARATPRPELATTGYCLADPGREYLVYLPEGGRVSLDLSAARGRLPATWYRCSDLESREEEGVEGGARRELRSPFEGDAVLHVRS